MHTNFDIAFDGLNDYFMEIMEFGNSKVLDITKSENLYKLAYTFHITIQMNLERF